MTDPPLHGPRKPRVLSACNGCGVCCVATPCGLALEYVDGATQGARCPALEWSGGRSWCGLIRRALHHSRRLAEHAGPMARWKVDRVNLEVGKAIRDALGDGECDSGMISDDAFAGVTAAEFLAIQDLLSPDAP